MEERSGRRREREERPERRAGRPTYAAGGPVTVKSGKRIQERGAERRARSPHRRLRAPPARRHGGQTARQVGSRAAHPGPRGPAARPDPSGGRRTRRTGPLPGPATAKGRPPCGRRRNTSPGPRPAKHTRSPNVTGHRPATVHLEAVPAEAGQRLRPPRPDPLGRGRHVGDPQRVVARDPGVEPQLLARREEHRASPAAPPGQFDAPRPQPCGVDELRRLRAAEHQRRDRHRHGRRRSARVLVRNCSTSKRDSGEGKPQDAAARYGSHNGSTSDR